jgi:Tfp pilus assembly protein PilE
MTTKQMELMTQLVLYNILPLVGIPSLNALSLRSDLTNLGAIMQESQK